MKNSIAAIIAASAAMPLLAVPPEITNVRAEQREGTKLVDIHYDATDADGDLLKVRIEVSDNDGVRYSVPAFSLTGDIGEGIAPGMNKHIVWDAGTDWDGEYSDQMRVKVFAVDAKGYPGLEWGDEVPPGGFLLGQDGGAEGSGPSRHVNIPWSYWLSKYEITVGQYCDFLNTAYAAGRIQRDGQTAVYSIAGTNIIQNMSGSYLLVNIGDYNDIRWSVNNFEVVGESTNYPVRVTWYGAIAFAHFYGYDLPTEAEWEKAARGPDHDDQDEHQLYAWGNELSTSYGCYSASGGLKPVGYYNGNQTPIGPDTINGYGLYDMTGNISEWTLTSGAFGIASYPQQESIMSHRHQYWYSIAFCTKGGCYQDGLPRIYKRELKSPDSYSDYTYISDGTINSSSGSSNNALKFGFRVARRFEMTRSTATCEIKEDFEGWTTHTSSGSWIQTSSAGEWKMTGSWGFLKNDHGNAYSGNQYVCGDDAWNGGRLHLPTIESQIIEIRAKVKNPYSSTIEASLSSGSTDGGYTSHTIQILAHTDWQTISLSPTQDAEDYYISFNGYLDDLEIWTIPREAGE